MWYDESIRRTNIMKNKFLLTLSVLSTAVVLSACGSNTSGVSEENTETEIVASVDTETETTEETTETEEIESTEIADTEVESTQTVDTENETDTTSTMNSTTDTSSETTSSTSDTTYDPTRTAGETPDGADAQSSIIAKYGSTQAWGAIARENGADGTRGYYWYYENGSAAGDKPSYMVYMEEGSPYYGQTFQYGDTLLDGTINQNGTNEEYYAALQKEAAEKLQEQGEDVEIHEDGTFTWYIN
jgi:hypothetical protein